MDKKNKSSSNVGELTLEKLSTDEDLFAYFAYKRSKEIRPEVYSEVYSVED